jgi:hypothetical protein
MPEATNGPPPDPDLERAKTLLDDLHRSADAIAVAQDIIARAEALAEYLIGDGDRTAAAAKLRTGLATVRKALHAAQTRICDTLEHKHAALTIELWKQTITVQQHFNDLELRIRNLAISVFTAVLGATGFVYKENLRFSIGAYSGSLASALLVAGALVWLSFYFMDRWWYHMLLIGSVRQGLALEDELRPHFPNAVLTRTIGDASPIKYGFAVAALFATIGLYAVAILAPPARAWLGWSLFGALVALLLTDVITRLRRQQAGRAWSPRVSVLLDTALIFLAAFLVLRAYTLWAIGMSGAAAVLVIAAHEHADTWKMHSPSKIDVFYLAGLLVFGAVGVCMYHTTRPATEIPMTTTRRIGTEVTATNATGGTVRHLDETATTKTTTVH